MGGTETPAVRFAVLGPVRAWRADVEVDLGPPQQKATLAVLLVCPGQRVGLRAIVDVLWGDDPPASAVNIVHRSVGRLRRLLEPELPVRAAGRWLIPVSGGYRFGPEDGDALDLLRFRALCGRVRQASAGAAVDLLLAAVGLWQGPCAAGIEPQMRAHPLFAAVDREYLAAVADLADAALRAGVAERVLPVVREAAAGNEWDERLQARLVQTLAASGRQAEALAAYARVRSRLEEELGIDPGPELRAAQDQVLRQEFPRGDLPWQPGPTSPAGTQPAGSRPAGTQPAVRPAQLPADLPVFTGRENELSWARALLDGAQPDRSTPLVAVIDGMAGVGKTTLAVHWAHEVADRFPGGQLYVDLRGFGPSGAALDPGEVLRGFLEALGVAPAQVPTGLDAQAALYRSLLAGRRTLILLDNARDVDQVRPLLPGSAGCLVIVTSRSRLSGLIAAGAHPVPLGLLRIDEARRTLAGRLGEDRVAAEPAAVEEIIAACGRLPLALAVVAARATAHPDFPLGALVDELRETAGSLDAFAGEEASTDARVVFSWSYRTLTPEAAHVFRLLAGQPGPDIAASAAASLAGLGLRQARPLLAELTRANLLTERMPGRYAFHDLLRAYATELAEELDTPTERRDALHRVLDHYLHTACTADHLLSPHRDPITLPTPAVGVTPTALATAEQASAWLATEYAVLQVAIRDAATGKFHRHAWQLTWALQTRFDRGGHWHDWEMAQRHALAAAQAGPDPVGLAYVHRGWGILHSRRNRTGDARRELERALELFRELGDVVGQAHVELVLGSVIRRIPGQETAGFDHEQEALRLYQVAGHRIGQAWALNNLGFFAAVAFGDHNLALDYCQRALAVHQELGDVQGEANAWDSIAYANAQLGEYDLAVECYQRAVQLQVNLGDRYYLATALVGLGKAHQSAGNSGPAGDAWRRALTILSELGHPDAADVRDKLRNLDAG